LQYTTDRKISSIFLFVFINYLAVKIFSFVLEANVLTCSLLPQCVGVWDRKWCRALANHELRKKINFSCPMVSLFFYRVLRSKIEMAGLGGIPIPSVATVSHCPLSPHVFFFSIFYAWLNVNTYISTPVWHGGRYFSNILPWNVFSMDLRIIKPEVRVIDRAVFFLFSSSMTTKYAVLLFCFLFFFPSKIK